jgi:hypothetical protein
MEKPEGTGKHWKDHLTKEREKVLRSKSFKIIWTVGWHEQDDNI